MISPLTVNEVTSLIVENASIVFWKNTVGDLHRSLLGLSKRNLSFITECFVLN